MNTHSKAAIINKWWAGIFAALIIASALGSYRFAWDSNNNQIAIQTNQETMQTQIKSMQGDKLPERMAAIEQTVKNTDKTVESIDRKMDAMIQAQMLQTQMNNTRPAR